MPIHRTLRRRMGVALSIRAINPDGTTATSRLELDQARISLGRSISSDVLLPHGSVSPLHATLQVSGAGYAITDEGSTNGTYVGGTRLVANRPRTVRTGDTVQIGPFRLEVSVGIAVAHASTSHDATAAGRRLLPPEPRSLAITNGNFAGTSVELPARGEGLVLGRAEDSFVRVDDAECSRRHALLDVDDDSVVVRDAESKNGVVVNGKSTARRALRDGDELMLGATVVVFADPRDRLVREIARATEDLPFEPPIDVAPEPSVGAVADEPSVRAAGIEIVDLPEAPAEPSPARPKAAPRERLSADAITDRFALGLAILVLLLSIAGFAFLFGDAQ